MPGRVELRNDFAILAASAILALLRRQTCMSNRNYAIAIGLAVTALIAVLVASYLLHRLTFNPISVYLLSILIVVPIIVGAVRLLPRYLTTRVIAPGLQERMRERRARDPLPAYAVWTCVASFGASFALMIVGALLMPDRAPGNVTLALFLLWTGLFLYGWLGLIYTSPWVQTHGFAIALAAIPTVGLSTAVLLGLATSPALLSQFVLIPVGIGTYGLFMIMTPIFVSFSRMGGLID